MNIKHVISVIDSHTAGEPTRIIVDGFGRVQGRTMAERMAYLKEHMDWLRRSLMHEPRGHRDMFGAIMLPPLDDSADASTIYMESDGYLNMCGHGTLGICAMLVETGRVAPTPPETVVRLEVPAGIAEGPVTTADSGRVTAVSFIDVPSYAWVTEKSIAVPGFGDVAVDVGFGGNFFVIVEAARLGLQSLDPDHTPELIRAGMAVLEAANRQIPVQDHAKPHIQSIDLTMITSPPSGDHADARNIVVFGRGQADRSPCGSGTCARMAVMPAKGELSVGQAFRHESSIHSVFNGRILSETSLGDRPAIVPQIACRPFLTGFHRFVIDPEDPFGHGFML
jgi:proline racemase